jgi:hypothetical protein
MPKLASWGGELETISTTAKKLIPLTNGVCRKRSPGIDTKASMPLGLCILASRNDNPIPTRCLAPNRLF